MDAYLSGHRAGRRKFPPNSFGGKFCPLSSTNQSRAMLLGLFSYKHVYINAINAKQIRKMIKIIIFPNGYNIIWIYSFCFLKNIFYHQVKTLSNFGVDKILLQFFYWTVRNFSYLTNWNLLKVILILLQKTFKLTWQMNLTNIILIINVIEFFFFFWERIL